MPEFKAVTATHKLLKLKKRIRAAAGGCLAKGTRVLMYDLSTKPVEDVVVGDVLMGADSKPRNVLKLYGGRSTMYKVHQKKGQDYIVNDKHTLIFEDQGVDTRATIDGKRVYTGRKHESGLHKFTAEKFYEGSWKSTERRFKGIKASLDFKEQAVNLDPYYLGLWLGDGTSRSAYITNVDEEILNYLYGELPELYDVKVSPHDGVTVAITKTEGGRTNDIVQRLKGYGLILNKHIPKDYIKNSREVRLQLLAGLIDSDGCLAKDYKTKQPKGYYITQKRKQLAEDIALLSRSLGYHTTLKERTSTMKREDGTLYTCQTYTIAIFAKDYTEIPVKVERKKCTIQSIKNPLRSTVKLEKLPEDYYYGFELDGDHLFLLEDFTITHNTSASKTISILLILIDKCTVYANQDKKLLVSVVSESLPHLKRGAMRDFINIMEEHGYFKESNWNRTDFIYSFSPNVRIEFFGVDTPDKVRGPRRDILFMNEANNCPFESFEQLEVRTKDEIWLDWNPTNEFWFYTEIKPFRDVDFITLTYKDNEALSQNIIDSIESRKHNKSWWKVYGLGELGDVEGKIYKDWAIIPEIPHEARLERLGLDFGYANDPASLVAIYYYNGGYILDELIHRTNMSNRKIADYINNSSFPNALVVADSAEPKSIAEMLEYGVQIIGSHKGAGSVLQGIQWIQDQRISITKRSTNGIKAYRNYMWKTDRDGKVIDKPDHLYSDFPDAVRYGMETLRPSDDEDKDYVSGRITKIWAG